MKKCSICLVWGVWENFAAARSHRFAKPTTVPGVKLDDRRLEKATRVLVAPDSVRNAGLPWVLPPVAVPLRPSKRNPMQFHDFGVQLEHGEFGEAYHVFVCRLLLGASPQINISVKINSGNDSNGEDTSAIEDLFNWYQIPLVEDGHHSVGSDSKAKATRVIAAAFRAANEADIDEGQGMWPNQLGQHALFEHIRDGLGALVPTKESLKSIGMPTRYFQLSYAAKYWLNRYFRLTKQFGEKKNRGFGMVKSSDVGRLAVIHVRLKTKSLIGRVMDDVNLGYVAKSIARANKSCYKPCKPNDPGANQSSRKLNHRYDTLPFTHVMLYGDFSYHKGSQLKELVEAKFAEAKPEHGTIHVSFISSPWDPEPDEPTEQEPTKRKPTELELQVDKLPTRGRDFNVDRLPTQVKTLGIWAALRERYDDRMCVIGHRSGFVESAGLLGIPIFYLNNERDKIGAGHLKKGELLWDASAVPNPEHDRLRELADVMNTFIPVEALGKIPEKKQSEPPLRARKEFEKELAAALFVQRLKCVF
ncbi:hypothetical protein SLS63_003300 [Diaporthe eres]|uniref:Uncharacterized protein n=1 Tax=Diaporthe eres TaxID=83184 RepID=A0ABR1PHA3_DIAER